ncbi:imidazole glycerol phosphate synthase subunit HisF, partial [Lacticaseibacillus paracasei]
VSLNSAAVANPSLLTAGAEKFGRQAIVAAIDTRWQADQNRYQVTVNGGRTPVDLDAITWAKQAVAAGAGELLVTSMDADGTESGFDLRLYQQLTAAVQVPIIASGGAGSTTDFVQLFTQTTVSAGLAASIFHFGELTVPQVKTALKQAKVAVR